MESTQHGQCRCGAVRYEFASSRWCAHDYSDASTRALGAPVTTWTGVRFDRLIWTAGEATLHEFTTDDRTRRFCSICGTTLAVSSGLWPEDVHVSTATIEAPYRTPSANLFIDQRVAWQPVDSRLPGFGGPNGRDAVGARSLRDQVDEIHPNIRVAARWDAHAIRDLKYGDGHGLGTDEAKSLSRAIGEYLDSNYPGYFLVAELDLRVVGYADIKFLPTTFTSSREVHLRDVRVNEAGSAAGMLTALIQATKTASRLLEAEGVVFTGDTAEPTQTSAFVENGFEKAQGHQWTWTPD